ncbi:MAG: rhomboid family intramembrane serine protease [Candidatus Sumerlaeota bacterium]|nr:rhomboid family intramembrane serine protease [Candidatus Sumerlaeota bacterium]
MERPSRISEFRASLGLLTILVGAMWALEIVDAVFLGQSLDRFGVKPRRLVGLRGILLSPWLHGGFRHLAANTVPFAVLGGMIAMRGLRDFVGATLVTMLVGGIGVWLFGAPNSVHIGASGLVFGYFGFLLACAWIERSLGSIVGAVIVFVLYGGLIWGLRPFQGQVSWLGHLFGLLGGVGAARLLARRRSPPPPDLDSTGSGKANF